MLSSVFKRESHDVSRNTGASAGALPYRRAAAPCSSPVRDFCVVQVTGDGIIAGCDSSTPRLLGRRREDLIGRGIDTFVFMQPDGSEHLMYALRAGGGTFPVEIMCVDVAAEDITVKLLLMRDLSSAWTGGAMVPLRADVCPDESPKVGEDDPDDPVQAQANHAFRERLRQLLSPEGGGARATLLFLDLNELDDIADAHGHETADMLRANVEARMNKCLRRGDVAACMAWDEFVAIIHDAQSAAAMRAVIDRITRAVRQPFLILGRQICLSDKIGTGLYSMNDTNPHELLKQFDQAMRLAAGGRSGQGATRFGAIPTDTRA